MLNWRHFILIYLLPITVFATSNLIEATHVREERRNLLGLFIGGSYIHETDAFIYGLEYHRVISLPFGFSIIAENSPNNEKNNNEKAIMALATLNIFKKLTFGFGPGMKFEKGEPNRWIGRFSVGHIIHFYPDVELTPNIDIDLNEANQPKFLFGFTIGKQF